MPETSSTKYVLENWKPGELLMVKKDVTLIISTPGELDKKYVGQDKGEILMFLKSYHDYINDIFYINFLTKNGIMYDYWRMHFGFDNCCNIIGLYEKIEQ